MEELSLRDILAILNRQKKYFFLISALIFAVALAVALQWSNYRSVATVNIEQSYVAPSVTTLMGQNANDAVISLADQRISKIEQTVTSLASLAEIITKFNLYPEEREHTPVSILTDRMRRKINLEFVSSTIANPIAAQKQTAEQLSAIAFKLSFDYKDPRVTQQVLDELVSRFLDEDLKLRRTLAQETSAFLGSQIAALEKSLSEQEKEIADFRAKHGESGPAALMFNQQAAATTRFNLQNIESQIMTNEGTQGALRAQLATVDPYSRVIADGQVLTTPSVQLKALEAQYATLTGQYGPDHPDVVKLRNQMQALKEQIGGKGGSKGNAAQLKAQIRDVQTNLAAARKAHGANHPDVAKLKRELASLKDKLAVEPASDFDLSIKRDADNPAYLQLAAQLAAAQQQHKSLLAQREALLEQQAKNERILAANPLIEQQMAKLSRDYENAQLRYRELKEKKLAADMNEELEQARKGQRLVVINPPSIPTDTQPRRILLLVGGFLVSVMGGLGGVVLAEGLNRCVHGPAHLTSVLGVAPLVIVPFIDPVNESIAMRRLSPFMRFLKSFGASFRWALSLFAAPLLFFRKRSKPGQPHG